MPPKTYTCAICGEQVSKRKSYLYDEKTKKRACKSHQEAQDKANARRDEDKKRLDEAKKKKSRRPFEGSPGYIDPKWQEKADETKNSCWKCLCKGLQHREFHMRLLVAMEKMQLEGESPFPNLFDAEETRAHFKKIAEHMKNPMHIEDDRKTVCLSMYKIEEKHLTQIRKRFQMAASLFGYVQLCPICAEKLDLKLEHPKELNLKQLAAFGAAYELTLKKPVKHQAEKELDLSRENFIRRN